MRLPTLPSARRDIQAALSHVHIKRLFSLPVLVIVVIIVALISGSTATLQLGSPLRTSLMQKLGIQSAEQPAQQQPATQPKPTTPTPAPSSSPLTTYVTPSADNNNQIKPGTKLVTNSVKQVTEYYAGSLNIIPSTITLYTGSVASSEPISISIPNGVTSSAPSEPWNDTNSVVAIAFHETPASGTSWTMYASLINPSTPKGTYYVHLNSFRVGQGTDSYIYHGFITVIVADPPVPPVPSGMMP